jgi:nucleoside-diphosphate-sugar epimerase
LFFGLPEADINEIYVSSNKVWNKIEDSNILLMGGSGFIGKWLVASMGFAQMEGRSISITVLSREPKKKYTEYSTAKFATNWLQCDLSKKVAIDFGKFTHIVNAATPSSVLTGAVEPQYVYDSIRGGNAAVLSSKISPAIRFINLSSGAVSALEELEPNYERERCIKNHLNTLSSSYSHGKRFVEEEINSAIKNEGLNAQSLRLFAFAGPGLPIDQHFAAGNFMKDAMEGRSIVIKGNPETQRSYMYPADLTKHILNSLSSNDNNTQEVGSREIVSIYGLAKVISDSVGGTSIEVSDQPQPFSAYFPTSQNLLAETIELSESIEKWRDWLSAPKS